MGLHFGEHTTSSPGLTTTKRGNCTIRAATRRRHADSQALMVQNPHQRCGAPRKGRKGWRARPDPKDAGLAAAPVGGGGARLRCPWEATGPGCDARGGQRHHRQTNFARNLTRSFFDTPQKRCNSNDMNSKLELITGELRATFLGNHDVAASKVIEGKQEDVRVTSVRLRRPGRQAAPRQNSHVI